MKKPNKIILFDIDHTIFDTNLYRKTLYANLAQELGYEPDEFYPIGQSVYDGIRKNTKYLTPDPFFGTNPSSFEKVTDIKKLRLVFWDKLLYESCIYPEVKKTFADLSGMDIKIGIFSTGDHAHQSIKIESLKEYLLENHIYISSDKFKIIKGTFSVYKDTKTYLVDDYPQILENAKLHYKNIFTIFIKRKESYPGLVIPDNFKPDATIANIGQITDIIKSDN